MSCDNTTACGSDSQDLRIDQGATFSMTMDFSDSTGAPLDVSGWTFLGQIRKTYSDSTVIAEFTFAGGVTTNQVVMSISDSDTALIPVTPAKNFEIIPTFYAYEVIATKDDLTKQRILLGKVIVTPSVSRV